MIQINENRDRPIRFNGRIALVVVLLVAAAALLCYHHPSLKWETILAYGKGLPAGAFIAAFLILPLLGAPISFFLILAGIRFGFAGGMAITSLTILVHHCVCYRISRGYLRERLRGFIESKGHQVPSVRDNAFWFTVAFAGIPGPPYFFKLYLLALSDVPFRIYLCVGAPISILFSVITVAAAAAVTRLNLWWIYAVLVLGSFVVFLIKRCKRLRNAAEPALR